MRLFHVVHSKENRYIPLYFFHQNGLAVFYSEDLFVEIVNMALAN